MELKYYELIILAVVLTVSNRFIKLASKIFWIRVSRKQFNTYVINSKAAIKALNEDVELHLSLTGYKPPEEPEEQGIDIEKLIYDSVAKYFNNHPIRVVDKKGGNEKKNNRHNKERIKKFRDDIIPEDEV